jgi:hypothetical protein
VFRRKIDSIRRDHPNIASLVLSFAVFLAIFFLKGTFNLKNRNSREAEDVDLVYIFTQESCGHCHELRRFYENLEEGKYRVKFYGLEDRRNLGLLLKHGRRHRISLSEIGTPAIFSKNSYMIGFDRSSGDDLKFLKLLEGSGSSDFTATVDSGNGGEELSLKFLVKLLFKEILSLNNFYTFIFLYVILSHCRFRKTITITIGYFGFLALVDFLFLTKQIDINLLQGALRGLLLVIGFLCLFRVTENLVLHPKARKSAKIPVGEISSWSFFFASMVTVVSSSLKFLEPTASWQQFEIILGQQITNTFLYHFCTLFSTIAPSAIDILAIFPVIFIVSKYKNYAKENLTIINNMLISLSGIFIIFA